MVQVEQADLRIISHSLSKITKSRSQNQEVTSIHLTNRSVDVQHKSSINLHPNLLNLNVFLSKKLNNISTIPYIGGYSSQSSLRQLTQRSLSPTNLLYIPINSSLILPLNDTNIQ